MDLIPIQIKTKIETDISNIIETGSKLTLIEDNKQLDNANSLCELCRKLAKECEEERTKLVKPLNDKVKEINSGFKPFADRLDEVQRNIKKIILEYQRKLAIEAEKIRIENEKRIREEQARKAKEEQERRLKEEQIKREMELSKNKEEQEIKAKEIEKIQIEKALAEFQNISNEPEVLPTIEIPKSRISTVKKYTVEVTDLKEFISYCLKTDQINFLLPDYQLMNKMANTLKGNINWTGTKVLESEILKHR